MKIAICRVSLVTMFSFFVKYPMNLDSNLGKNDWDYYLLIVFKMKFDNFSSLYRVVNQDDLERLFQKAYNKWISLSRMKNVPIFENRSK